MARKQQSPDRRDAEIAELRAQLAEARETLEAIRTGAVDGLAVTDQAGEHIFSLAGAQTPYRSLVEAIHEGALLMHADGTVLWANRRFAGMMDRALEEMIGKPWSDFFAPADRLSALRMLRDSGTQPVRGEFTLAVNSTGTLPVLISLAATNGGAGTTRAAIVTDLTERKQLESRLVAEADFARRVFDSTDARQAVIGTDGCIVAVNEAWRRFGQANQADDESIWGIGADYFQRHTSEDNDAALAEAAYAGMRRVQQGLQPSFELEYACHSATEQRWFQMRAVPLLNEPGKLLVSHHDITRRKLAETAVRESEARFRLMAETSPLAIFASAGPDERATYINPAFTRLFGYSVEELPDAAAWWPKAYPEPAYRRQVSEDWRRRVERAIQQNAAIEPMETVVTCKDGTTRHIAWGYLATPVQNYSFGLDLTDQKQAQIRLEQTRATLVEAQKIAHVGSFEYVAATHTTVWSEEEYRIYGLDPAGPSPEYERMLHACIHPDDAALLHDTFTKAMQGRLVYELEHRIVRPDGSVRWVFDRAQPYFDVQGELVRYVGITLDITERKQAEVALRASEDRFRQMAAAISEIFWMMTAAGDQVPYVSPAVEAIWGHSAEAIMADPRLWLEAIHPEDQPRIESGLQTLLQGERFEAEYRVVRPDGTTRWIHDCGYPIRDAQGQVTLLTGVCADITARRQMEEQLRASEEKKFQAIFDGASDGILLADMRTRKFGLANASLCRMLGYTAEELTAFRVEDIHPPAERSRAVDAFTRMMSGETSTLPDLTVQRKDGSVFQVNIGAARVTWKGTSYVVGFLRDVTERRKAEMALQESEARLRVYVQQLSDGFFVFDADGCFTEVNQRATAMYGYDRDEFLRLRVADLVTAPDWTQVKSLLGRLQPGLPASQLGVDRRKDGSTFPVEARIGVFTFQGQRRYIALVTDLTYRMAVEEERTRLYTAIEHSGETVMITDAQTRIQYVNAAFEVATGFTKAEAFGQTPRILKSGQHDEAFYQELWRSLNDRGVWRGRFVNRDKQGRLFYEDATISAVHGAQGSVVNYVAARRDVTREVQMEAQLRQSQKLDAIGQLAGGVAHDFNNILASILMQIGLLEQDPELGEAPRAVLRDLEEDARRAGTLTQQLLMFSRRSVLAMNALDLNEVLTNLLKMLGRVIGEQIRVRFDCDPGPFTVSADARLLEQVVMNLVINARDAMPNGGIIALSTASVEMGPEAIAANPERRPGPFVVLTVSDTGGGMDAATLARIFEPFFTTKGVGKGTGLGLATVHGIVAQHKGWVEVESEVGKGSTFRVYLPALLMTVAPAKPDQAARPVRRGSETILLVEDDAKLRKTLSETLRVLGYRVYEAANGQEAMGVWLRHGAEVDLLLTDMVMPEGITGLDLAERLQALRPGLMAIISSGYSAEIVEAGMLAKAGIVYLAKPYKIPRLAEVLRECLDRKP